MHDVLRAPGRPLDGATRSHFESRLGHDFGSVRIHDDARAARSAQSVGATAYTVGRDVVFDAGRYAPATREGKQLLAHELAHVMQQGEHHHSSAGPLEIGAADTAAEREADALAASADTGTETSAPAEHTAARSVARTVQREVSAQYARITDRLTYGLRDWVITDANARDVLRILEALLTSNPTDFNDTVEAMQRDGLLGRFFSNLSNDDLRDHQDTVIAVQRARVWDETAPGGAKTKRRGSCSPSRKTAVEQSLVAGVRWLDAATAKMIAYRANPAAPAAKEVGDAMRARFASVDPQIVAYVARMLVLIRATMANSAQYAFDCHETADLGCGGNTLAYVQQPEARVMFCPGFFGLSADARANTAIHETVHEQVGGPHATDRGYSFSRSMAPGGMSTEAALTNADSYAIFIRLLATGKNAARPVSDSFQDCPAEWKPILRAAMITAQEACQNASVRFEKLTPDGMSDAERAALGGGTKKDIKHAHEVFEKTATALHKSIDFECEPENRGRCEGGTTVYWFARGDYHICANWLGIATPLERSITLLGGLFGYLRHDKNIARGDRLARLAHLVSSYKTLPTRDELLGSPAWTDDLINIRLVPQRPLVPEVMYEEDQASHERMTDDLPTYGPPCHTGALAFEGAVRFRVDRMDTPRPGPFTPPRVSVEFIYNAFGQAFHERHADPAANYTSAGEALSTTFDQDYALSLRGNGTLGMSFRLVDPDSNVTLVYTDSLPVNADRPCPPAGTP